MKHGYAGALLTCSVDRYVSRQGHDPFPYFTSDEIGRRRVRFLITKSEIVRIKDHTRGTKIFRIELTNHARSRVEVKVLLPGYMASLVC